MTQRILALTILLSGLCAAPLTAHAATGPASVYKVTITQF